MQLAIAIPTRNDPTPLVLDAPLIGVLGLVPARARHRGAARRAGAPADAFGDAVAAAAGAIDVVDETSSGIGTTTAAQREATVRSEAAIRAARDRVADGAA